MLDITISLRKEEVQNHTSEVGRRNTKQEKIVGVATQIQQQKNGGINSVQNWKNVTERKGESLISPYDTIN